MVKISDGNKPVSVVKAVDGNTMDDSLSILTRSGTLVERYDKLPSIDQRIDLTEKRFLEEIDSLESMKNTTEREEKISVEIAKLMLELEKVQLRRRKEEMESAVNWNHLQAVAEYFVKRLYMFFDDMSVDAEIEDQIMTNFSKFMETWESDIIKDGVLELPSAKTESEEG
jgi:hypothetical protein